jgi:hypothetical protein
MPVNKKILDPFLLGADSTETAKPVAKKATVVKQPVVADPFLLGNDVKKKESSVESATASAGFGGGIKPIAQSVSTSGSEKKEVANNTGGKVGDAVRSIFGENDPSLNVYDIRSLSDERKDLNGRISALSEPVYTPGGGAIPTTVPEEYKTRLSEIDKQLNEKYKSLSTHLGQSEENVKRVLADFPEETDPDKIKSKLEVGLKNPISYGRLSAANSNQQKIAKAAGNDVANRYNELNDFGGTYSGMVHSLPDQIDIINQTLSGRDKDIALANLRTTNGQNFNKTVPDFQYEYDHSDYKGLLNIDQYAGLQTLKYFSPNEYKQAVSALGIDVKDEDLSSLEGKHPRLDAAIEERKLNKQSEGLGKEVILKKIVDIGRSNAENYLSDHNHELNDVYENTQDEQQKEAIRQRAFENAKIIKGIADDRKQDAKSFPLQNEIELDQLAKEVLQKPTYSVGGNMFNRFTKGIDARPSIENMLVGAFFGDNANTHLQMRRLGEHTQEQAENLLPSSFGDNSIPFIPKFADDVKKQAKEIANDHSLSGEERDIKIKELISGQLSKSAIDYVSNPNYGKERNFLTKASLYHATGMVADVAAFAAQSYGLGLIGASKYVAAGVPMFLTSQNEYYKEAVAKGEPNPQEYADLHAAVMFAAGAVSPQLDIAKKALGKSTLGKVLEGVDEKTWEGIVSKNARVLQSVQNSFTKTAGQATEIAATYGLGTSIANDMVNKGFFNEDKSWGDIWDDGVKAAKATVMDSAGLLALTAATNAKHISTPQKAAIWDVGANLLSSTKDITERMMSGELTPEQGKERMDIVNKVNSLIKEVPTTDMKGRLLTDGKRLDYMYKELIKDQTMTSDEMLFNRTHNRAIDAGNKGLMETLDAAIKAKDKEGGIEYLREQSLSATKAFSDQVKDSELVTDIIATNKPEAIAEAIRTHQEDLAKLDGKAEPTEQDIELESSLNRGIKLLQKGLEKATKEVAPNQDKAVVADIDGRTPAEVEKMFNESLDFTQKYKEKAQIEDLATGELKEMSVRTARAEIQKRHNFLKDLVICLT